MRAGRPKGPPPTYNDPRLISVLKAADGDGIDVEMVAAGIGTSPEMAQARLDVAFKYREAARVPHPVKRRAWVWRYPQKGDLENGFIFEDDGEPMRRLITTEQQAAMKEPQP